MSNEKIDLTQIEGITKGEWVYHEGEDRFMGKTAELHIPHPALDGIQRAITIERIDADWPKKEDIKAMSLIPELIAELKRCYEELDFLKANVLNDDELWWIATCKPDGEGQCTMEIEGYEELMRLEKEGKIEVPEYSHGHDEILLYECECGVTHEEWLESKN